MIDATVTEQYAASRQTLENEKKCQKADGCPLPLWPLLMWNAL
jgi:hypothetical protein